MSYSAVRLNISSIKQLIKSITRLPTPLDIRSNIIEVAEAPAEGYVVGIAQVGLAEDEDAVLECKTSDLSSVMGEGATHLRHRSQDLLKLFLGCIGEVDA